MYLWIISWPHGKFWKYPFLDIFHSLTKFGTHRYDLINTCKFLIPLQKSEIFRDRISYLKKHRKHKIPLFRTVDILWQDKTIEHPTWHWQFAIITTIAFSTNHYNHMKSTTKIHVRFNFWFIFTANAPTDHTFNFWFSCVNGQDILSMSEEPKCR